jgi:hypothetical protein
MRAAQESARQMNDYVKVRGVASRSAIGASLLDVLDAPCLTHPTLTFRSLSCRLTQACTVRDLNAQWENNTDKMIAKNQFKKRCVSDGRLDVTFPL